MQARPRRYIRGARPSATAVPEQQGATGSRGVALDRILRPHATMYRVALAARERSKLVTRRSIGWIVWLALMLGAMTACGASGTGAGSTSGTGSSGDTSTTASAVPNAPGGELSTAPPCPTETATASAGGATTGAEAITETPCAPLLDATATTAP